MRKLSTGEPCAGEPHARFGGRGESAITLLYPYVRPSGRTISMVKVHTRESQKLCN